MVKVKFLIIKQVSGSYLKLKASPPCAYWAHFLVSVSLYGLYSSKFTHQLAIGQLLAMAG
jgi:hypothetical protein